jgi:AbrB family looped-hinge helix DNA binding protein
MVEFELMANTSHLTTVAEGGRIVIPAGFRKALGIRPGDKVILQLEKDELRVYSRSEAVRRLQEEVARVVPKGVSLVQQLIQDRRKEAARE